MPNDDGSALIVPVCAGFINSGAPSCARQEKSGAQPLRAQALARFSSQCPLARCTCRRCFECLPAWLAWRLDRRQRGLATRSPCREGNVFQVEVAPFDAPGEHSVSLFAALGVASSASLAAPAYAHSRPSSLPLQVGNLRQFCRPLARVPARAQRQPPLIPCSPLSPPLSSPSPPPSPLCSSPPSFTLLISPPRMPHKLTLLPYLAPLAPFACLERVMSRGFYSLELVPNGESLVVMFRCGLLPRSTHN